MARAWRKSAAQNLRSIAPDKSRERISATEHVRRKVLSGCSTAFDAIPETSGITQRLGERSDTGAALMTVQNLTFQ